MAAGLRQHPGDTFVPTKWDYFKVKIATYWLPTKETQLRHLAAASQAPDGFKEKSKNVSRRGNPRAFCSDLEDVSPVGHSHRTELHRAGC